MAHRKTLNAKQLTVLRWVGDGCPEGVLHGYDHRISAAALRNRGLIETFGRGPTWSAAITEAGREYLTLVDGPNPPLPRQANTSVTEQLINEVVAAGGSLRVPRKSYYDRTGVDFARRAQLAVRYGKVPEGKSLAVKTVSSEELEIALIDAPPRGQEVQDAIWAPRDLARSAVPCLTNPPSSDHRGGAARAPGRDCSRQRQWPQPALGVERLQSWTHRHHGR